MIIRKEALVEIFKVIFSPKTILSLVLSFLAALLVVRNAEIRPIYWIFNFSDLPSSKYFAEYFTKDFYDIIYKSEIIVFTSVLFFIFQKIMVWISETIRSLREVNVSVEGVGNHVIIDGSKGKPSSGENYLDPIYNLNKRIDQLNKISVFLLTSMMIVFVSGVFVIVQFERVWPVAVLDDHIAKMLIVESAKKENSSLNGDAMILALKTVVDMDIKNMSGFDLRSFTFKVGILVLIVYVMQIMLSFYRYNSKLIAFYGSRREAFIMAAGDLVKFREYCDILFPLNVDFGKAPENPVKSLGDALSSFMKSHQKTSMNERDAGTDSANGARPRSRRSREKPATGTTTPESGEDKK
jgi:hypothetical protein